MIQGLRIGEHSLLVLIASALFTTRPEDLRISFIVIEIASPLLFLDFRLANLLQQLLERLNFLLLQNSFLELLELFRLRTFISLKEIAQPLSLFGAMHYITLHVKTCTLSLFVHCDDDSSVQHLLYMLLSLGSANCCRHIASLIHLPQGFAVKSLLILGLMGYFILMNDGRFGGLFYIAFREEYTIDSPLSVSYFC